jgi:hypothetical protein
MKYALPTLKFNAAKDDFKRTVFPVISHDFALNCGEEVLLTHHRL